MKSCNLSPKEIDFLKRIDKTLSLLKNNVASPAIQSLIDRGYCKTSPMRIGPLGIYSGDIAIILTEAGKTILNNL